MTEFASIGIDTSLSQADLEAFLNAAIADGPGIGLVTGSIVYSGADRQAATFTGGDALGVSSGFVLTTGRPDYDTPDTNDLTNTSTNLSRGGDADLQSVIGRNTFDANSIEFKINVTDPDITFISFDVVFGSEEYPEYADNIVDIAGVFVNDTNVALFDDDPNAPLSVLQANIDAGYIRGSNAEGVPTEYDGVSRPLQITAAVEQGVNTVKIAVADTNDRILDSAIFVSNIRLTDADGESGINVTPEAADDAYAGDEDTAITVAAAGVLANDTDFDEDPLTAVLLEGPAHGALTLNEDGSFTYTPDDDFSGTDSFVYAAEDPDGAQSEATVTLSVAEVNDAPVAGDDGPFEVEEGVGFFIGFDTLLINDDDGDANTEQTLSITGIAQVVGGTATLGETGVTFTADAADEEAYFKYTLSDGSLSDLGVVSFVVSEAPNAAPLAADDTLRGDEDTTLTGNVLANDSDPDKDALTAVLAGSAPAGLVLNTDGSFSYTPAADANGTVTFEYVASDGALTSQPATVTLIVDPVNDAPVGADDTFAGDEDTALAGNVLANDSDVDTETLTAVLVEGPATGTLDFNADGTFEYLPTTNATGDVTFTYRASDGALTSGIFTVTLSIEPVNDAPVGADDAFSGDEDTAISGNVLDNDTDVDSEGLVATLVDGPENGTFLLNGNGAFVFTPDTDFNGTETFTYRASDGALASDLVTVTLTVDPVNDAPVAQNDSFAGDEDETLKGSVLLNDTDAEDDALTVRLVSGPESGELELDPDGRFTFVPLTHATGEFSFTYVVSDGAAESGVATATLTIAPVNDAPVGVDDAASGDEDTVLTGNVLSNDTDVDNITLSALLLSGPETGTLMLQENGAFTFTPADDFSGTETFTYRASDGALTSEPVTVTLTVDPVNDAPVGAADTLAGDEDGVLSGNVLGNDSDVDGDNLTAALVEGPQNGTLVLDADGGFDFTPDADFNGTDTFTYRASDGAATSEPVTVTLTVDPVNDAPVAGDDTVSGSEGTVLTGNVLSNDFDIDSETITATVVEGPSVGTLDFESDGGFSYTAPAHFNGTASFSYRASDGALTSDTATVTLVVTPVNTAPEGVPDTASGVEDTVLTGNVLSNDTDVDSETLTAALLSAPDDGSLTLEPNGDFAYTPAPNASGTRTFTYEVSDGEKSDGPISVTLHIEAVNDAPVATGDEVAGSEDESVTGSVLGNDADVDGDPLTATLETQAAHGFVALSANGTFTYTPDADFNGTDTFSYVAGDGALESEPATVTITVAAVNDAPVLTGDTVAGDEDTPITGDVLGNDVDVDDDPLTVAVVAAPEHGALSLGEDGTFTYTPHANFNGPDRFTYSVGDGAVTVGPATVEIAVRAVNDAPEGRADTFASENASIFGNVLDNDSDVEGDPLTAVLVSGPQTGTLEFSSSGAFSYNPGSALPRTETFTYRASDGDLTSALVTVSLVINPINDPPLAVADLFALDEDGAVDGDVLANDMDAEFDPLTAVLVSGPADGELTFNSDGTFRYVPNPNFNGTDSFTYQADDGELQSAVTRVTLDVAAVNDVPQAADDAAAGQEDGTIAGNVLANDTDADGETLTASLAAGPAHGSLALNADGAFVFTPDADFNGTDSFTYRASDGTALSALATVDLTVAAVNDAPVASGETRAGVEDTVLTGTVLGNDSDADGDALTAVLVSGTARGALTLDGDGTFTYTPAADFHGTDSFRYRVSDGEASSAVVTATLSIAARNDLPVAAADTRSGVEDRDISGNVLANDTDVDGDALSAVLVSGVAHGTLDFDANGAFTYTPHDDFNGTDTFRYRASDGTSLSAVQTVTLNVAPVNDAPVARNDARAVAEDGTLQSSVLGNDGDVDGDTLSAVLVRGPSHGAVTLSANGQFTYTPDANFNGADAFTYRANDGTANSGIATVALTVRAVNDAPIARNDTRSGLEDGTITGNVTANDTDVEGQALIVTALSGPSHGTLTLGARGTFTYRPDADFSGADSFTYRASDGAANSGVATVTLNVAAVSDDPVARNDSGFSVTAGHSVTLSAASLIANDDDGDPELNEGLSIVSVDQVVGGTARVNGAGNVVFSADDGVAGTGRLRYEVRDSAGNTDRATAFIEIGPDQVFSDVSLDFVIEDGTPSLVYTVEGSETASTAQFLEVGDPLDDLPITLRAEDSDDGTLADYPIDPEQFGGLFGPDFVDETRVTDNGIAIVDGEDYYFSDSASTIEGNEALIVDFDNTADIASAGSAEVRLGLVTGGERVRAQVFDDGALIGTFTSEGDTIDIEAPEGRAFDTVRLFALGSADFTFEGITLLDVFERPVLEI